MRFETYAAGSMSLSLAVVILATVLCFRIFLKDGKGPKGELMTVVRVLRGKVAPVSEEPDGEGVRVVPQLNPALLGQESSKALRNEGKDFKTNLLALGDTLAGLTNVVSIQDVERAPCFEM